MLELKSFYFKDDILYILDQRKLPHEEVYFEAKNVEDVAYAIKAMLVRGAPAIGCVAVEVPPSIRPDQESRISPF